MGGSTFQRMDEAKKKQIVNLEKSRINKYRAIAASIERAIRFTVTTPLIISLFAGGPVVATRRYRNDKVDFE